MMHAGKLTLIAEAPMPHGAGEAREETRRDVYCTVKSVGRTEAYMAMSAGHMPRYIFALAHDFEYKDERLCEYNGIRYRILRTYMTEDDGIELTVER